MPQKKNPDALELVRGKAARVDGDLVRLLDPPEGPARRLPEGPAGGQGGRLRRGRHRAGLGRRDDRSRRGPGAEARDHARRRRARGDDGGRPGRGPGPRGHALPQGAPRGRLAGGGVAEGRPLAQGRGRGEAARPLAGGGRTASTSSSTRSRRSWPSRSGAAPLPTRSARRSTPPFSGSPESPRPEMRVGRTASILLLDAPP